MNALRFAVAAIVLCALPQELGAQPAVAPASIGLPSIGLPLPVIGLPLPAITPSPIPAQPIFDAGSPGRRRPPRRPAPAIVFFGAPYDFGFEQWQQSAEPGVIASPPAGERSYPTTGRLFLDVEPADAQVFVDGQFFGTLRDIDGTLDLPPGSHRLELRLNGYEPVTFDTRIDAGRGITYRTTLSPIAGRDTPPVPAPPPADTTFYFIPGCYLGNVPPDQVKLPAGCDLSKMVTHKP